MRGSEAHVGLPAPALDEARATVGAFLRIRVGHRTAHRHDHRGRGRSEPTRARASAPSPRSTSWARSSRDDARRRAVSRAACRSIRRSATRPASSAATNCARSTPSGDEGAITIGTLHHDEHDPARVSLDNMLTKHFAMLGSTGVGKSSGVAVILNEILDARPEPAHFPARRPQRIRPLLRRARQCRQRPQPEAAVLAVQFRGIRRRALRRPSRRRRGSRHPRRAYPGRQGDVSDASHRAGSRIRSGASIRAAPATPSTRPFPTCCRI